MSHNGDLEGALILPALVNDLSPISNQWSCIQTLLCLERLLIGGRLLLSLSNFGKTSNQGRLLIAEIPYVYYVYMAGFLLNCAIVSKVKVRYWLRPCPQNWEGKLLANNGQLIGQTFENGSLQVETVAFNEYLSFYNRFNNRAQHLCSIGILMGFMYLICHKIKAPHEYEGALVRGWPPGKSRNVSNYVENANFFTFNRSCWNDPNVRLLIMVKSGVQYNERRDLMRNTWIKRLSNFPQVITRLIGLITNCYLGQGGFHYREKSWLCTWRPILWYHSSKTSIQLSNLNSQFRQTLKMRTRIWPSTRFPQ